MMRDFSLFLVGIAMSLPIWFGASWLMDADVHADLRDCRAALSAFVEIQP